MPSPFQNRVPNIAGNEQLRQPQQAAYQHLVDFAQEITGEREVGIVLPVGCGKSGTIAITPFAFRSARTLVVAPNVKIAQQLLRDVDPSNANQFYSARGVLDGMPFPEPVEIRGQAVNRGDLDDSEIVVTNIQQLQGAENRWLRELPDDFFDLILFDEGHHNVAATWAALKAKFPRARIVNFSATPLRSDGQRMAGRILYSYPIVDAIRSGYVKRLKAVVLNPRTLRYVREVDGHEIEVSLDEVRRLGEEDADFRRSIVTSPETLNTIVDASIRELDRLRDEGGDRTLKIIASALNYQHCHQVVAAYRARGRSADFVHSREDGQANERVMRKLEANELDVIVQVRKLGEGFDHPKLAVAAVFSVFGNLSPFVQFVGRIMRVIDQNAPDSPRNRGVVVFHAGANIARRWEDFQEYSQADQQFFDELLPVEGLDFGNGNELTVDPMPRVDGDGIEVRGQTGLQLEELHLLADDAAVQALQVLADRGYSPDDVRDAMRELVPVPITRQRQRQADRAALVARTASVVGAILAQRGINPEGRELDRNRLGRSNFVVLKAAIDRHANALVGRSAGERHELSREDLATIEADFDGIVARATAEVIRG
ncbi:DEAD/DEAH box helicase [Aureimonas sp. AU12]|uniref:DEAD/DEAH box helicase n=1 Tax=Aureimonas sp. AU12 TaxID=1638161 RepID=UPI0009EA8C9F|nr:DEAD/DEAH box helicase family protein [Aureimonas sp. AU12]